MQERRSTLNRLQSNKSKCDFYTASYDLSDVNTNIFRRDSFG